MKVAGVLLGSACVTLYAYGVCPLYTCGVCEVLYCSSVFYVHVCLGNDASPLVSVMMVLIAYQHINICG